MNNSVSNKKTILLRRNNPPFKLLGDISSDYCLQFSKHIKNWTLRDTLQLRDSNNTDYDASRIKGYNHSNIQYNTHQQPEITDYNLTYSEYNPLVEHVQNVIGNTYRMRWAKLNADTTLDWHLDPPTGDRFVIVVRGSHLCEVKLKDRIETQEMLPGEVWYLNSNWYHRVINPNTQDRYAILGCFDFNHR